MSPKKGWKWMTNQQMRRSAWHRGLVRADASSRVMINSLSTEHFPTASNPGSRRQVPDFRQPGSSFQLFPACSLLAHLSVPLYYINGSSYLNERSFIFHFLHAFPTCLMKCRLTVRFPFHLVSAHNKIVRKKNEVNVTLLLTSDLTRHPCHMPSSSSLGSSSTSILLGTHQLPLPSPSSSFHSLDLFSAGVSSYCGN